MIDFPLTKEFSTRKTSLCTLRDEFAMAALSNSLSDSEYCGNYAQMASHCYRYADAMLEARKVSE